MADDLRTRIELREIRRMLETAGDEQGVVGAALQGLTKGIQRIQRDVIANRISGQYLGVVTGTARKSIRTETRRLRDRAVGVVGSPLGYVRAHELGFSGEVPVPAHTRTLRGKTHNVRSHSRRVKMRARRFIRDSLRDGTDPLRQDVLRALASHLEPRE